MVESEFAVIGTLLISEGGTAIETAERLIKPSMFFDGVLRKIYEYMLASKANGIITSLSSVTEVVKETGLPDEAIREYLIECTNKAGILHLTADCMAVVNAWRIRSYKAFLSEEDNITSDNVLELMNEHMLKLQQLIVDNSDDKIQSLADITDDLKGQFFVKKDRKQLHMPFPSIDQYIGGIEQGDLIVIGARPGVGKSAFTAQVANCLAKDGFRIGFYSLEMTEKQMFARFLSSVSGIPMERIRESEDFANGEEKEKYNKAVSLLQKRTNLFIRVGSKTVSEIRRESQYMNYDLIIIDYLQLIKPEGTYKNNRYAEVGEISHSLKAMALDFKIPVIALSQLNRVSVGKQSKVPTMAEMRESGDIEQDSSVILLMWDDENDQTIKHCKVEKNRQGKRGETQLKYDGTHILFKDSDGFIPSFDDEDDGFRPIGEDEPLPWL